MQHLPSSKRYRWKTSCFTNLPLVTRKLDLQLFFRSCYTNPNPFTLNCHNVSTDYIYHYKSALMYSHYCYTFTSIIASATSCSWKLKYLLLHLHTITLSVVKALSSVVLSWTLWYSTPSEVTTSILVTVLKKIVHCNILFTV